MNKPLRKETENEWSAFTLCCFCCARIHSSGQQKSEKMPEIPRKSGYKAGIAYNQGFWNNERLQNYLQSYRLDCVVIGNGANVGVAAGRPSRFEHIWTHFQNAAFVSELHLDMFLMSVTNYALVNI